MKFLAIKGYWKHQHYHKRGAPWIKLYASVLVDPAFIQMPEAAQAQLMKLWVLASQFGHPLPNNQKLLAGKIGTTGKFYLASMIAAGFVIPCETEYEATLAAGEKNASKFLDESEQNATSPAHASAHSRESKELEGEVENTLHHQPALAEHTVEAELGAKLASDADRVALTVVVSRASDRLACLTAFSSMLMGNDPATPQPTSAVFGQALRDLATNGERPTARKFRNYLTEAARGGEAAPAPRRAGVESWSAAKDRKDQEEGERALVANRWGSVEQRKGKEDGEIWWSRMKSEAQSAGKNAVLYAFDRMNEPAEVNRASA